jgi:hypothetical protein
MANKWRSKGREWNGNGKGMQGNGMGMEMQGNGMGRNSLRFDAFLLDSSL